jgi:flagellar biosynthesis/type III secretory pathway chaperone
MANIIEGKQSILNTLYITPRNKQFIETIYAILKTRAKTPNFIEFDNSFTI